MKILVAGGSGFIGTNLIEKLIAFPSYTILNIDNAKPKIDSQLKHWKECGILNFTDILDSF
jgi:nucleoside-diphosphate-sugar epimerase